MAERYHCDECCYSTTVAHLLDQHYQEEHQDG
jgi:hypothetical protein